MHSDRVVIGYGIAIRKFKLLASSAFLLSNVQRPYGNKTSTAGHLQDAITSIHDSAGVPDRGATGTRVVIMAGQGARDRLPIASLDRSNEGAPRPPHTAQEASAKTRSVPTRTTVDRGEIYFESGKSDLNAAAQQTLNDIAQSLRGNTAWKIEIIGYADARGNKTSNLLLSKQRAENVRKYFHAHGIAGSRLRVTVGGENRSSGTGSNARRVKIVWH